MKKQLITSALPYVNGLPHLGHLVGCLLPSDVYARYLRQKGADVLYICGTDEHGTPAEVGAAKENMDVKDYCKKYHDEHVKMYQGFNLSFDFFGRTSSDQNKEMTYRIYKALEEKGLIEREVDENNKRAYKINLTKKGIETSEFLIQKEKEWDDMICEELDISREELLDLLANISLKSLEFNRQRF